MEATYGYEGLFFTCKNIRAMKTQETTIEMIDLLPNFVANPAAGDFSAKISLSCRRSLLGEKTNYRIFR